MQNATTIHVVDKSAPGEWTRTAGSVFRPPAIMDTMVVDPAAYDEIAAIYQDVLDPGRGDALQDPVLERLLPDLHRLRVLSLACGPGRDARMLADLGASVVGVDVSENLLTYAREFERSVPRKIDYLLGDAQELVALTDASFDGVVCNMALMDIPDLTATARSVRRVLRPGGFFIASVVHPCFGPHVEAIDGYLIDGRYRKVGGPDWLPPHAFHRSLSTYLNTFSAAGLMITEVAEPADDPDGRRIPNLLYLSCRAISVGASA